MLITPINTEPKFNEFPRKTHRIRWFLILGDESNTRVYSSWDNCFPKWSETWETHKDNVSEVGIELESVEHRTIHTVFLCNMKEFSGFLEYFGAHKGSVKTNEDGKPCINELTNYSVFGIAMTTTCGNKVIAFHDGSILVEETP